MRLILWRNTIWMGWNDAGRGRAPLPTTPHAAAAVKTWIRAGGLPPSRDNPVSWKLAAFTFCVLAVGTAALHALTWAGARAGHSLVRLRLERA